jgi:hypothetical protein
MTDTSAIIIDAKPLITISVPDLREFSFNEYVRYRAEIGQPINGDREAFHAYLPEYTHRFRYTLNCWWMWWDRFVQMQDARDEAETLADALV